MTHRLFLIEGLPCSGKSTTAAFVAAQLRSGRPVSFVDEGTGQHPADYEFHALAPAGFLSDKAQIVSLADFSGEQFNQLLAHKIYDFLPWETEKPLMLDKWRSFVSTAERDTAYIFNCVFLQNPMCETMMRFDFPLEVSQQYILQIADIIRPMQPVVIYLKNEDIATSVQRASQGRPDWLPGVIDYHVHGAYGRRIGASGFSGYIQCLQERQRRELAILPQLGVAHLVLDNPQRDWAHAQACLSAYLATC